MKFKDVEVRNISEIMKKYGLLTVKEHHNMNRLIEGKLFMTMNSIIYSKKCTPYYPVNNWNELQTTTKIVLTIPDKLQSNTNYSNCKSIW